MTTTPVSPKTCTTAVGHQPWHTFPAASAQPGLPHPSATSPPAPRPTLARSPSSQAYPATPMPVHKY